jgi:hypothetical protein
MTNPGLYFGDFQFDSNFAKYAFSLSGKFASACCFQSGSALSFARKLTKKRAEPYGQGAETICIFSTEADLPAEQQGILMSFSKQFITNYLFRANNVSKVRVSWQRLPSRVGFRNPSEAKCLVMDRSV